jgi:hypothetical protein
MSHVTFKLIHCAKTWHPWPDHIWLMSQSSHVIIYVLQLCHFHDNVTLHDYNHKILITMCAIDLVWPFFKIKTPWWRAHICKLKTFDTHTQKHNMLILYIVIWMQSILQCIINSDVKFGVKLSSQNRT